MRSTRVPRWPTAALLAALTAVACGGVAGSPTAGLQVVATTSILGDLAADLLGDEGEVEVLIPAGQDPHGSALSPRQASALRSADLVVANGLGLEESLFDAIEAAEADGVAVVRVADAVVAPGPDGDRDPHFWLDPTLVAVAVEEIGRALAAVAAGDGTDWVARADELADEMRALDEEVAEALGDIPDRCRSLVTNHEALGHFAARYGFTVVGTVLPGASTGAAPSARDFADLIDLLDRTGIPAIFADSSDSSTLAASLAAEVDHEVAVVALFTEALGEPGSGADSYPGLMRTNATRIAAALACP